METKVVVVLTIVLVPVVLGYWKDTDFCQKKDATCKMSSGRRYGCCPAADGAVCCAGGDHCCPSGFKCDLSAKQCLQHGADPEDLQRVVPIGAKTVWEVIKGVTVEKIVYRMERVKPYKGVMGNVNSLDCPGKGSCDDTDTCCLGTNGYYNCCPFPGGNCCDDYVHCCPSGTVCDTGNSNCISPQLRVLDRIPFLVKSSSTHRRL